MSCPTGECVPLHIGGEKTRTRNIQNTASYINDCRLSLPEVAHLNILAPSASGSAGSHCGIVQSSIYGRDDFRCLFRDHLHLPLVEGGQFMIGIVPVGDKNNFAKVTLRHHWTLRGGGGGYSVLLAVM